jgi:uncharacterized protein YbjT (DUF2867 family)
VGPDTEVVEGDVLREKTLKPALEGVHTAFYLVHSMGSADHERFEEQDRRGAENFGRAARAAGVRRCTSVAWAMPTRSSRPTCAVGRRSAIECARRAFR